MKEGTDMTLTCHTVRDPRSPLMLLYFTFYKDGQRVATSYHSDTYEVESAQPEDSGNYTCEVQNGDKNVLKTSKAVPIRIQGVYMGESEYQSHWRVNSSGEIW